MLILLGMNVDRYNLRLERNEHLLRGGNKVRMWVADSPVDGVSASSGAPGGRSSNATFGDITLEELPQVIPTLTLSFIVVSWNSSWDENQWKCLPHISWSGTTNKGDLRNTEQLSTV